MPRPLLVHAVLALTFLLPAVAFGEMLHVPGEYGTISAACAVAQPGDTVAVAESGYAYVEYVAVPGGVSVIGQGSDPSGVRVRSDTSCQVFAIDAGGPVLLERMTIYSTGGSAVWNSNPDLLIKGCVLDATSIVSAGRLVTSGGGFTIRMSELRYVWDSGGTDPISLTAAGNVLVEDCVWQSGCYYPFFDFTEVLPGSHFEFRNNTFVWGVGVGVMLGSSDYSMEFVNCIFMAGGTCGSIPPPDSLEWRYNDFPDPYWPMPNCGYLVGNFQADPRFCDPPDDLRLQPNSPCLGHGEGGEDVGARLGVCWEPADVRDWPRSRRGLCLSNPRPLPSSGEVRLTIQGQPGSLAWPEVLDASGRVVRYLPEMLLGPEGSITWDGRLASGSEAPTGMYWVRVRTAEGEDARRVILVR